MSIRSLCPAFCSSAIALLRDDMDNVTDCGSGSCIILPRACLFIIGFSFVNLCPIMWNPWVHKATLGHSRGTTLLACLHDEEVFCRHSYPDNVCCSHRCFFCFAA